MFLTISGDMTQKVIYSLILELLMNDVLVIRADQV